jgi:hypothetical protein
MGAASAEWRRQCAGGGRAVAAAAAGRGRRQRGEGVGSVVAALAEATRQQSGVSEQCRDGICSSVAAAAAQWQH